jgi:hypothetical protein
VWRCEVLTLFGAMNVLVGFVILAHLGDDHVIFNPDATEAPETLQHLYSKRWKRQN